MIFWRQLCLCYRIAHKTVFFENTEANKCKLFTSCEQLIVGGEWKNDLGGNFAKYNEIWST